MTTIYRRTAQFDCVELEGEFAIMEPDSQAMVTLNPAGRLIWDALEHGAELDDLGSAFCEAFPDMTKDTIRDDIRSVLEALVVAKLAFISAK